MILFRSIAFQVLFYANLVGQLIVYLPFFFVLPIARRWWFVKVWARSSLWLLRVVAGTRSELTGHERIPAGPLLVASKHQSFWEVIALIPPLDQPTFILKKELTRIPLFGWYLRSIGMIPIDRKKRGAGLPQLLQATRRAAAAGRQIIIFPEGTRTAPGAAPAYRPGVQLLYSAVDLPVVPVALNSGLFWPRQAVRRQPGTIRAEFLDPIPPGLPKRDFLAELTARIETRSDELLRRAVAESPDLPLSERLAANLADAADRAGF